MSDPWPPLLGTIVAVFSAGTLLSLLLARWRVLPGTTAIWSFFPATAKTCAWWHSWNIYA